MSERFARTIPLLGEEAVGFLASRRVIVFGAGGVGGYIIEGLARMGVGRIDIVDGDVVDETNLNRQIFALCSTIGLNKADVAAARVKDINPTAVATAINAFYLPENADSINLADYDYVVDAIDTVTAKIELAVRCHDLQVPLISVMGTGNKLDPEQLTVGDIYDTSICPLCKVMRRELRARNIPSLKVVWSPEPPRITSRTPASVVFVPAVAGMLAVKEIIASIPMPL